MAFRDLTSVSCNLLNSNKPTHIRYIHLTNQLLDSPSIKHNINKILDKCDHMLTQSISSLEIFNKNLEFDSSCLDNAKSLLSYIRCSF